MKSVVILAKSRPLEFYALFFLMVFATVVTTGKTIALGLLPLLVYFFFKDSKAQTAGELLLFCKLFAAIFCLNFLAVFDWHSLGVDMPHPDYHFYAKIASYFNEFGVENYLNAKHFILENTSFAVPYRSVDTWILAVLNKFLPIADLESVQLVYRPLIFTAVSFTFFKLFKSQYSSQILLFVSAILVNFFLADYFTSWLLRDEKLALISVSSYHKLWIYYIVFLRLFCSIYKHGWKENTSVVYLALLPLLMQTTFPVYGVVFLWMIFDYKFYLKNYWLTTAVFLSILYFGLFYYCYQDDQTAFYTTAPTVILNSASEIYKALQEVLIDVGRNGGLVIGSYLVLVLLFLRRKMRLAIFVWPLMILISGMLLGILVFPTPNSYQFYLNLLGPVFAAVLILLLVVSERHQQLFQYAFIAIALVGFIQQQFSVGFYNCQSIWNTDESTVNRFKKQISEVDFPIGVTYYKQTFDNYNENFNQRGADILLYANARLDVVNIRALELSVFDFSSKNSAISIWRKQHQMNHSENIEERFLKAFPFRFLFTDCQPHELPSYLAVRIKPESAILLNGTTLYLLK
ncbi:hypothetical protein [Flavobacterium sp.]|uniref:hypothetical protein n=1 Tax=Flavobacterium sp. TaxID=239 RepID=UPI003B9B24A8